MPLSSVASYISTITEFEAHWTQWNNDTSANNALSGSFKLADLTQMKADIQAAITAVEVPRNQRENAGTDRDSKKAALIERLRQFRASVTGNMPGSTYVGSLPVIPAFTAGEGVFMKAMDDMQSLWVQINAAPPAGFTGPLKLIGNYTAANHATDLAALRTTYLNYNTAVQNTTLKIAARDALLPAARQRLIQYRTVIAANFLKTSALYMSLPRVTPLPGATPKAVSVSWVWNGTTNKADLSWEAATGSNLKELQIRACDPPSYRAADETLVATIAAGSTSYSTNFGLGVSGAVKLFKVYVVTLDLNEKGSNSVKVTRP